MCAIDCDSSRIATMWIDIRQINDKYFISVIKIKRFSQVQNTLYSWYNSFPTPPRYSRISKNNDSAEMLWSGKGYCAQTSKYHMTNVSIGHRRILKSMFILFAFAFYHLCFSLYLSLYLSYSIYLFLPSQLFSCVFIYMCNSISFSFRILNKNAFSALIFLF